MADSDEIPPQYVIQVLKLKSNPEFFTEAPVDIVVVLPQHNIKCAVNYKFLAHCEQLHGDLIGAFEGQQRPEPFFLRPKYPATFLPNFTAIVMWTAFSGNQIMDADLWHSRGAEWVQGLLDLTSQLGIKARRGRLLGKWKNSKDMCM